MENFQTQLIKKFYEVMRQYREGKYGKEFLNVFEMLNKAGEPNLLNNMSIDELIYLEKTSSGETKVAIKNLRIRRQFFENANQEQQSKSRHR